MPDVLVIHIVCTAGCRSTTCHETCKEGTQCHTFLIGRYLLLPCQPGYGLCSLDFLDAFAKSWKATMSFVISVYRSSVCLHEIILFPLYWIFMKFGMSFFFRKCAEKIQVSLKYGKNNGYFVWRTTYIYNSISLNSSQNERHFSVDKIKTHTVCSIIFLRKSWRLWDIVENHCRARRATDDNIIRRRKRRSPYRITTARQLVVFNTHYC